MPQMPKASATRLDWSQYWTQSLLEQARKRHAIESKDPEYLYAQNPEVFATQGCAKDSVAEAVDTDVVPVDCLEAPLFLFLDEAGC